MIKDLISVVMPTYNRSKFLPTRIAEIMVQEYQDWELIIVDDCSTDDTEEVVASFEDERIRYIKLDKNSGCVSIPRNIGIVNARGEYIYHADDDDIHHPAALRVLYNALQGPGAEDKYLAYGDRYVLQNGSTRLERKPNWDPSLAFGWGVGNGQFLYRVSCFEEVPLVFCRRACDYELCKEIRRASEFVYINDVVMTVIWHDGNRSLDDTTKTKPLDVDYYLPFFKDRNCLIR